MRRIAILPLALLAFALPVHAEETTVSLGSDYELQVRTDEVAGTLTAVVSYGGDLVQSVTIGNASYNPDEIAAVVLCEGCDQSYYIGAWDRSSTYGATTGLVVWSDGGWWRISILPLSVAGIDGPGPQGVFTLTESIGTTRGEPVRRFSFRNGFLIEQSE